MSFALSVHVSGRAPFFHPELSSLDTARTGEAAENFEYINYVFITAEVRRVYLPLFRPVPVRMVCGSVRVWLALLPPLPAWKQNLPARGGAASPPTGCVTTRTTVAMVRMRSARSPALRNSSAVPARQGEQTSGVESV